MQTKFHGILRLQSGAIGDGRRFPKGWEGFGAALTACEFDVGPGASTRPTLEQLISALSKGPEGFENPHKQRKAEAFSCLGFRNGLSQRSSRK